MRNLKLSSAKVGKYLVLRHFCGKIVRKRLNALGLLPGEEVEVIEPSKWKRPIICKIKGSNIALGRGLAEKVELEEI